MSKVLTFCFKRHIVHSLFQDQSVRRPFLANTSSARKRARQAEKGRQLNSSLRSRMRTYIKMVVKSIEKGDKSEAEAAYKVAVPIIDSSVAKGLLHKNKAARHKSRLNAQIKQL